MDSIVFFIVHHSTSYLHTSILERCIGSIRKYYTENKIIVCKTSVSEITNNMINYNNIEFVNTPIDGTHVYGALYILANRENINNYIFMHDSMILIKRLPNIILTKKFYFLWHFNAPKNHYEDITMKLINDTCELTPELKQKAIDLYHNGFLTEWRGVFGPAFGGNFETLKILWNALNVSYDTLISYGERCYINSAERYFALIAKTVNILDTFDNTYSLNGDITNNPHVFEIVKSIDSVDYIIENNSYNSFMIKFWMDRPIKIL
jgi:hypothetical protein